MLDKCLCQQGLNCLSRSLRRGDGEIAHHGRLVSLLHFGHVGGSTTRAYTLSTTTIRFFKPLLLELYLICFTEPDVIVMMEA